MKRAWDGCTRRVVGHREATLPPMRAKLSQYAIQGTRRGLRLSVLECGHTHFGQSRALSVGEWVMCSECRDGGDPRKSTTGQD